MGVETKAVENQILVTKLLNGTASQQERDTALATVLLSLWGQQELRDLIKLVHNEECKKCPLRVAEEKGGGFSHNPWMKVAMVLLRYLGWVILIVAGVLKISLNQ